MQSIYRESSTGDHTAQKLNLLISGEMALVGMYTEALKTIDSCSCKRDLAQALHCHQGRADLLAGEVRRMGIRAYQATPAWRMFAYIAAGTSLALDQQTILTALSRAEAKLSEQYEIWMADVDFGVQKLARDLFPRQELTESQIGQLTTEDKTIAA